MKQNRLGLEELLERKIGICLSRLGSGLVGCYNFRENNNRDVIAIVGELVAKTTSMWLANRKQRNPHHIHRHCHSASVYINVSQDSKLTEPGNKAAMVAMTRLKNTDCNAACHIKMCILHDSLLACIGSHCLHTLSMIAC